MFFLSTQERTISILISRPSTQMQIENKNNLQSMSADKSESGRISVLLRKHKQLKEQRLILQRVVIYWEEKHFYVNITSALGV